MLGQVDGLVKAIDGILETRGVRFAETVPEKLDAFRKVTNGINIHGARRAESRVRTEREDTWTVDVGKMMADWRHR